MTNIGRRLSIILVHYKTKALTLQCLQSLILHTQGIDYEIIVIDNDSNDGIEEALGQFTESIQYFNTTYNAGFSRANNEGMRLASGNTFLFLNTDCLVVDNSISEALNLLESEKGAIGCGVQLHDAQGKKQQSAHYFVTGGLNFLLPLPVWGKWLQKIAKRFTKIKTHPEELSDTVLEVDWVSGAFMMVRRSAVERAGMMDEDFFLYGEEVEWFSRLRKVGKVLYFPDLRCTHLEGGSAAEAHETYVDYATLKGRQLLLSNLLSVRKRCGMGWFILHWMLVKTAYFTVLFKSKKHMGFIGNVRKVQGWFFSILLNKTKFYKAI